MFSQFFKQYFLLVSLLAATAGFGQEIIEHYEGVLGTSLDITVHAPGRPIDENVVERVITEIARLEQILTTYDDSSELMQLNLARNTDSASTVLLDVVSACEDWFTRTGGVFSCRIAEITDFWDVAENIQELPSRRDVSPIARKAFNAELTINTMQNTIVLGDGIKLDASGLAKGYIIDKAMQLLRQEIPEAAAIKVDIGGDAAYWGSPPGSESWEVMVANPQTTADNGDFIGSISLNAKAVATSGHTNRTRQILMRQFSHIFNPLTGWPISNGLYSVVIANDAMTADAVATTLSVLPLERALALVESLPDVEALLVNTNGARQASSGWDEFRTEDFQPAVSDGFKLTLDYSIPAPTTLRNYEQPYVAIWISTTDNRAIKNLILLGENERWAGSNNRWWRFAGNRSGIIEKENVTQPTKPPGEYQLVWDGRDDVGDLLPPGDYLLNVEFSREHGGHRYRAIEFAIAEGTQVIEQARYGEIGAFKVTVEMQPPAQ